MRGGEARSSRGGLILRFVRNSVHAPGVGDKGMDGAVMFGRGRGQSLFERNYSLSLPIICSGQVLLSPLPATAGRH